MQWIFWEYVASVSLTQSGGYKSTRFSVCAAQRKKNSQVLLLFLYIVDQTTFEIRKEAKGPVGNVYIS